MYKRSFFEFFAGGGMARAGLGASWRCRFANDFDPTKAATYRANWGSAELHVGDVNHVTAAMLPGCPDLVWASFPCQDLSVAGGAAGIGTEQMQTRSGAFWAFWRAMLGLLSDRRAPALIVLENVYGVLTANGGRDFAMIARSLALGGYRFGAMLIDAVDFVPQSRARVFIVAIREDMVVPSHLTCAGPVDRLHPPAMLTAIDRLAEPDRDNWLWLSVPRPEGRRPLLCDMMEQEPADVVWHAPSQTAALIGMMSATNLAKLATMQSEKKPVFGTIYKRTRRDLNGQKVQRAELRCDQISGCLRTPAGGSSRQIVIRVDRDEVRTRLLSVREAARLMGLPDTYILPARYNDAYHIAGDGLVVPVVRHLAHTLLEPVLDANDYERFLQAAE